jgi:Uma2 family endonuclease
MATDTMATDVLQVLPAESRPNVEQLVTEDDTPVDNTFSEKQQRLLTEPLYSSWAGPGEGGPFVAMANVALFYAVLKPPIVPDVLLSLGVELPADLWPKPHRSYFVWQYGKAPDVVIEIVSNDEGGEDSDKLEDYARVGVGYYVIFDPEDVLGGGVLRAYRRDGLVYRPLSEPIWFPDVGMGLQIWHGLYEDHENTWLRWVDPQGQVVLTGRERAELEKERAELEKERAELEKERVKLEKERAEREKERAEREKERAEREKERADREQGRAERLVEQLRRLGIEPEA